MRLFERFPTVVSDFLYLPPIFSKLILGAAAQDGQSSCMPAVTCAGNMVGDSNGFAACQECFQAKTVTARSCTDLTINVCGVNGGFLMDKACGETCFTGAVPNSACLAEIQTFSLGIFDHEYGFFPDSDMLLDAT